MSSASAYASACLSIGLASAWAPARAEGAIESEIRIETNLAAEISYARLMFCGSGGGWDFVSACCLTILDSQVIESELTVDPTGSSYALLGLMDDGSGVSRLVVSHPGLTIVYGNTFESIFPDYSEQALIDLLRIESPQADSFLMTYASMLGRTNGQSSEVAGFSLGEHVGDITVTWTAVPAPGAAMLLPLWLVASRRRR